MEKSQCFQRSSAADASKCVYEWESVNWNTHFGELTVRLLTLVHIHVRNNDNITLQIGRVNIVL